jgi:site-specific DNA-cytosine methylase
MPNDTEPPESWLARAALLREKHHNGNGAGMPLAVAVKLGSPWATPTVNDAQNATAPPSQSERNSEALAVQSGATVAAALSPAWVCRLMGFPDGWTVIDGPPAAVKRSTPASPRARRRASP